MKKAFLVTVVVGHGANGNLHFAGAHREAEQEAKMRAPHEAAANSQRPAHCRPTDSVPARPSLVSHSVFTAPSGQVILTEIYELVV